MVLDAIRADAVGVGTGFDLHGSVVFGPVVFGTVVDVLAAVLRAAVHLHPVGLVHGAGCCAGGCDADGRQERPGWCGRCRRIR